eukprot:scaffold618670_cov18-Prasinocladus_malaysianus.AAC.1
MQHFIIHHLILVSVVVRSANQIKKYTTIMSRSCWATCSGAISAMMLSVVDYSRKKSQRNN